MGINVARRGSGSRQPSRKEILRAELMPILDRLPPDVRERVDALSLSFVDPSGVYRGLPPLNIAAEEAKKQGHNQEAGKILEVYARLVKRDGYEADARRIMREAISLRYNPNSG
jgi:hypothetical protein